MLAEHALKVEGGDSRHAPPDQLGQTIEVKQVTLRKQHHERADRVVEQRGLNFACGVKAGVVNDFPVRDGQLAKQLSNNRRRVRNSWGAGNFSHGVCPVLTTQMW
ncbi:hypothetical protein Pfra02_22460 [Pseudomonas fragi]|nr:hypothetical protein Pfra02_22460 [Pseudomonas fragi]